MLYLDLQTQKRFRLNKRTLSIDPSINRPMYNLKTEVLNPFDTYKENLSTKILINKFAFNKSNRCNTIELLSISSRTLCSSTKLMMADSTRLIVNIY